MARAESDQQVVITEDKDFGQLVFTAGRGTVGCVLLRYPANARLSMAADAVQLIQSLGNRIPGSFVTAEPGRVRKTRLPGSG